MEVLLLHKNQEDLAKFVFFIEGNYGAHVTEVGSLDAAFKTLQAQTPKIDLVIMFGTHGTDEQMRDFASKVSALPAIFILDEALRDQAAAWEGTFLVVAPEQHTEEVTTAIDDWIEQKILEAPGTKSAHVRIRTRLLLSVCPLKGDVFIRLNDQKFVRLFKEGDVFDLGDMEKYTIKKGVEHLYIKRDQCKEFISKLGKQLQKTLDAGRLSVEGSTKLAQSVHEAIQELVANVGFTPEVQNLVKTQVDISLKAIGKDPGLADLMRKFQNMEGLYVSTHSILTANLACAMAVQMQWGSAPTFHKLTLAGFLHDITLENQELSAIKTLEELEVNKDKFSLDEIKQYREHAIRCAELVRKMNEVPPDVETIIRQHHERPDGTGFPGGLSHKYIAPLSSLFIVAHDLADYALEAKSNFNIEVFIQKNAELYKSSYFRKIVDTLESLHKF